jgi:formamidopyrimidine-DNA glycosylase
LPELPEVETVRRVLESCLIGQVLISHRIVHPTFYRQPPKEIFEKIVGKPLQSIDRRGKYLILGFSNDASLILHLGMSGRLNLTSEISHLRLQLHFSNSVLNFQDSRRFGRAGCQLPKLGPEPLSKEFSANYLHEVFRKRRASVKSLLMDQSLVAGLGNIYASETLFQAQIRPQRPAKNLSLKATERLVQAIKEMLALAIDCGGTTLPDASYLDPLGRKGTFQKRLRIYGKTQCPNGHPALKTRKTIAGRKAYYCPDCQK